MNANVGMVCPVAATVQTYTPGTSISYNAGMVIAEARSAQLSWQRSNSEFYGDDIELDNDNGITGYTLEFEPTGLTDAARGYLLGETVQSNEYTVTDKAAPEVGFGYVRVMRATGTSGVDYSYEGWWFYKVRFGVTGEETRTKEQSIEWRVPTLTGNGAGVLLSASGDTAYATHKTFDTKAAAIAYVKAKAGIT